VLETVTEVSITNLKLQIVTVGDYICVVFFCVCWQPWLEFLWWRIYVFLQYLV